MNKKVNTVFFIIGGTLVNIVLAIAFIGVLLFGLIKLESVVGQNVATLVPFVFIGGILLAMIIYQKLSRWVVEKFQLGDKLDPLITWRDKKRP
jgi:hypothetical protein